MIYFLLQLSKKFKMSQQIDDMDNGTFDVEKYRNPNESNTEWKMRRKFLLAHNDKLSEDRLVCLANCYVHVEVYGCT